MTLDLNRLHKIGLIMLFLVFAIFFINVIAESNVLFGTWIHWPMYVLMVLVPLLAVWLWIKQITWCAFGLLVVSTLPFITFSIWFIMMLKELGEALSHF